MTDKIQKIYSTGVDPIKKDPPKPKLKISKQKLDEQIQQFFKTKKVTQVPTGTRTMPEFVWWADTIPKNRKARKTRRTTNDNDL